VRTDAPAAEELTGLLAHDLRTPLNAVRGFADLLLAGAAGPLASAQIELVVEIAHAGRALEAAVRAAQELGEPVCQAGAPDRERLEALLREAGFAVRSGTEADALLAVSLGTAGLWRRLLAACREHFRAEGAPLAAASLRAAQDDSLELVMEHTDMPRRWQMSSLRERVTLRLAAAAGASVASKARMRRSCSACRLVRQVARSRDKGVVRRERTQQEVVSWPAVVAAFSLDFPSVATTAARNRKPEFVVKLLP
jgi:signal transduction histidine kinase